MPFKSRKQWRAAYAGKIPGVDAHEWAHETKSYKSLPERAPAEKGKPTLRSKSASLFPHPMFKERVLGRKELDDSRIVRDRKLHPVPPGEANKDYDAREVHPAHWYPNWDRSAGPEYDAMVHDWEQKYGPRSKKAAAEAAVDLLEQAFTTIIKTAALGAATMNPRNVGRLRGMMTTHAMKTPGYAASQQAMNPRRNVIAAMNFGKPH